MNRVLMAQEILYDIGRHEVVVLQGKVPLPRSGKEEPAQEVLCCGDVLLACPSAVDAW